MTKLYDLGWKTHTQLFLSCATVSEAVWKKVASGMWSFLFSWISGSNFHPNSLWALSCWFSSVLCRAYFLLGRRRMSNGKPIWGNNQMENLEQWYAVYCSAIKTWTQALVERKPWTSKDQMMFNSQALVESQKWCRHFLPPSPIRSGMGYYALRCVLKKTI